MVVHSISTNAVPFEEIESILRKELGKPLESVYEYIDPTPVASASIPQVYLVHLYLSFPNFFIRITMWLLMHLVYITSRFMVQG